MVDRMVISDIIRMVLMRMTTLYGLLGMNEAEIIMIIFLHFRQLALMVMLYSRSKLMTKQKVRVSVPKIANVVWKRVTRKLKNARLNQITRLQGNYFGS
jgi:hypothetical protein